MQEAITPPDKVLLFTHCIRLKKALSMGHLAFMLEQGIKTS
jgi:hypothetical protein